MSRQELYDHAQRLSKVTTKKVKIADQVVAKIRDRWRRENLRLARIDFESAQRDLDHKEARIKALPAEIAEAQATADADAAFNARKWFWQSERTISRNVLLSLHHEARKVEADLPAQRLAANELRTRVDAAHNANPPHDVLADWFREIMAASLPEIEGWLRSGDLWGKPRQPKFIRKRRW